MPEPSWQVAATVREPLDLLIAFTAHHLGLGAARVILFFDKPDDPAADHLAQLPRTEVVRCDDAHWRRLGLSARPALQTPRQNTNVRAVIAEGRADWTLHIDADEFLWAPDGVPALIRESAMADWVLIPPLERLCTPDAPGLFDGPFRGPVTDVAQVYGREAPFLMPSGLAGYDHGKPMVPARSPFNTVTHKVMDPARRAPRPGHLAQSARILHFEGLTPTHWAVKQLRYAAGAHRRPPMRMARAAALREIISAPDVRAAALDRFERTYRLPAHQLSQLEARGALHHLPLNLASSVAALGLDVDFTGARLDAALAPTLDQLAQEVQRRQSELLA